jgi:hypothetical protein
LRLRQSDIHLARRARTAAPPRRRHVNAIGGDDGEDEDFELMFNPLSADFLKGKIDALVMKSHLEEGFLISVLFDVLKYYERTPQG